MSWRHALLIDHLWKCEDLSLDLPHPYKGQSGYISIILPLGRQRTTGQLGLSNPRTPCSVKDPVWKLCMWTVVHTHGYIHIYVSYTCAHYCDRTVGKHEDLCLIPSSCGWPYLVLRRQSPVDPWGSLPWQPSIAGKPYVCFQKARWTAPVE